MLRASFLSLGLVALAGAGLSPPPSGIAPGQDRSLQQGVYTAEQAERGEEVYESVCVECHQLTQFTVDGFLNTWEGETVYPLYEYVRMTMPYETPGTLKQEEYIDVLAYIFSRNGLPTGEEELPADDDALGEIVIEGPFKPEGGRNH